MHPLDFFSHQLQRGALRMRVGIWAPRCGCNKLSQTWWFKAMHVCYCSGGQGSCSQGGARVPWEFRGRGWPLPSPASGDATFPDWSLGDAHSDLSLRRPSSRSASTAASPASSSPHGSFLRTRPHLGLAWTSRIIFPSQESSLSPAGRTSFAMYMTMSPVPRLGVGIFEEPA